MTAERQMVILTAIIAVATAVNVWVFWYESEDSSRKIQTLADKAGGIADSMNTALSDNRIALSNAFEANRLALEASQQQAKSALDTTIQQNRLDQRAWIGMKGIGMAELKAEEPVVTESGIVNTGKTIARNCIILTTVVANDGALDISEFIRSRAFLDSRGQAKSKPVIVFPGGDIRERNATNHGETADEISSILADPPRRFIYVLGQITYEDIFGRPHTTHFCGMWVKSHGGFDACDTYNDAY